MFLNKLNKCFRLASQITLIYKNSYINNTRFITSNTTASNEDTKQQSKSFSDDFIKNKILENSLKFVSQFGFTNDAIEQGI
jgi:hypothetical protein